MTSVAYVEKQLQEVLEKRANALARETGCMVRQGKLTGATIVLFAWHDPQRSLVKLAQVCRDTAWTLMEALAGFRSLRAALRLIQRRMQSGCRMNTRGKRPNSAQLLQAQAVEWALSWCE